MRVLFRDRIRNPKFISVLIVRMGFLLWDAVSWIVVTALMLTLRSDLGGGPFPPEQAYQYAVMTAVLQVCVGLLLGLYLGRFRIGSYLEASTLGITVMIVGVSGLFVRDYLDWDLPVTIVLTTPLAALLLTEASRFATRWVITLIQSSSGRDTKKVLIYGAGNAGHQLGRMLRSDDNSPYEVVGFIDDDPAKRRLRLAGSQVVGNRGTILNRARALNVDTVIFAIPSASDSVRREITSELSGNGLRVLVLPSTKDMIGDEVRLDRIRPMDIGELLGRREVKISEKEIAGYLNGKTVLITGAGGSIGSELARQVKRHGPAALIMLDRDESGLHGTQLSISGQGLLDTPDYVLCDIRDEAALQQVFETHRPDVVFHAAALKHLPMLEQYPEEGWKTNVVGTLNVLRAASKTGVQHFVNISTDKAADPTSVLGVTKRCAEELTSWFAAEGAGRYLSVRFGNVLGSRGSVLHTFRHQIATGGPVTVVHPEITRYFMTIPEAALLTIQAGAIGKPGTVLVLDMGDPIKIIDVAKMMIDHSGKNIDIRFSGLRPGEKLHEVLFSVAEDAEQVHPLISAVVVPTLDPKIVRAAAEVGDWDSVR